MIAGATFTMIGLEVILKRKDLNFKRVHSHAHTHALCCHASCL